MTADLDWLNAPAALPDAACRAAALARQAQLTKPPGALGELETLAVELAALQARERPGAEPSGVEHRLVPPGEHAGDDVFGHGRSHECERWTSSQSSSGATWG